MKRSKDDAALTRQRLLDVALDVFLEQGYTRATLDQIASRAQVTRGAAYWHFPDGKPELYNTLVREKSALVADKVTAILQAQGDAQERLRAFFVGWCYSLETDEAYRKVMQLMVFKTEICPELENGMAEKEASNAALLGFIEQLINEGVAAGLFRVTIHPPTAALMVLAQMWGLAEIWLMNPASFQLSTRAESIMQLFLSGLSTHQEGDTQ